MRFRFSPITLLCTAMLTTTAASFPEATADTPISCDAAPARRADDRSRSDAFGPPFIAYTASKKADPGPDPYGDLSAWAMSTLLPDLNRAAVRSVFSEAKTAILYEIEHSPTLDSSAVQRARYRLDHVELRFIDHDRSSDDATSRSKRSIEIFDQCRTKRPFRALSAFHSVEDDGTAVYLCPALLELSLASPIGTLSLFHLLAHEIGHAVSPPDSWGDFRSLARCWRQTPIDLSKPDALLETMDAESTEARSLKSRIESFLLREKIPPTAVDTHFSELLADYWATRALRTRSETSKEPNLISENLILLCPAFGESRDDGMHLPRSVRRDWITRGLVRDRAWCEI